MARTYEEAKREIRSDPRRRRNVERYKAAMAGAIELVEARNRIGMTQAQLAERMGVSQARISEIERADELNLSTLGRYIEALGGRLDARAVFAEEEVALTPKRDKAEKRSISS